VVQTVETSFGGRTLSFQTGLLAGQANGAVIARCGDSVVLATVVMADAIKTGQDYFPLSVDYEERTYAIGKIPGSFLRREGRPPDSGVLAARLADRPLRPLFPAGMRNDVQIVLTILSHDNENETDVLGVIAASAALTVSDVPFAGPVGVVRVGLRDGEFILNPTIAEQAESPELDLVVAGTRAGVVMIEAGAAQVDDATVVRAINWAQHQLQQTIELQLRLQEAAGRPKRAPTLESPDGSLLDSVRARYADALRQALHLTDREARKDRLSAVAAEAQTALGEQFDSTRIALALDSVQAELFRAMVLREGVRPDGRAQSEIRPLSAQVGLLPRTHGTGLFQRGETQVLAVVTLGTPRDAHRIGLDNLGLLEPKRFMHHYNMPPFASGETGRLGAPRRREVGHGALGERALQAVIPSLEDFPYTIRVVSEVLSSNGSTSMAATCASTLALMDAGVPLVAPVAGISVGLVTSDNGAHAILTDIQGEEDHHGDMDFKVAGTATGITAVQVDIKTTHLTAEIIEGAVMRAREARLRILDTIRAAIPAPRAEVSTYAPKLMQTVIPEDTIGSLIGPGGKTIRRLEEDTGAQIDVEEDGTVTVASPTKEGANRALQLIRDLTGGVEIGRTILGKVTRLMHFGAFVEVLPGKEGLVPLGELAEQPVNAAEDVVSVGDDIMVMVVEIDHMGRINLSRRAVLQGLTPEQTLATSTRPPRRDGPRRDGARRGEFGGRGRPRNG